MRSFQSTNTFDPVPGSVVLRLRNIDRAAGEEARYLDQLPQLLVALRDQARIESVTASNAIEGVVVDQSRVPRLISGAEQRFRSRSEAEFAGYTAALDYLQQNDPGQLSVGLVLHLHRLLFAHTDGGGGRFKIEDNRVVDRHADGTSTVRFVPTSAAKTPFFVEELIDRTVAAFEDGTVHPLIIVSAFVLDFLCIHPFSDGNGRTARLLTTHLLERHGYGVGRYVSLEQLVYDEKDGYYAALASSTTGWSADGSHDLWPWALYLLGRIEVAYRRFVSRFSAGTSGGNKQDRVRDFVLLHATSTFTIADVRRAVPGVSDNTIRLVLTELRKLGSIANDGVGRGAEWRRL